MPGASLWLRPPIPGEFGVATCLGGPRIGAADVGRGAQRRHGWEDFDWGVGVCFGWDIPKLGDPDCI